MNVQICLAETGQGRELQAVFRNERGWFDVKKIAHSKIKCAVFFWILILMCNFVSVYN